MKVMEEDINDPTNIIGLSSLVNLGHVDNNLDLEAIEKSMLGAPGIKTRDERDPAQEFKYTIQELSSPTKTYPQPQSTPQFNDENDLNNNNTFNDYWKSPSPNYEELPPRQQQLPPRSSIGINFSQPPSQNVLDDAMRAYAGPFSDINEEKDREEDLKSILLEDIDELRYELQSDRVDLSRIPEPDTNDDIEKVKKIHKILRMKYDRKRCNNLGNEVILAGAQGLEYIFDGNHKIGSFSPNLTGWHNTVRSKLRRMKYETSSIVSSVMREYDIGPTARILMELVPSAFVYSRMRKDQQGTKAYSNDQMSEAFDDLRRFE